jgi:phosphomannomutase
MDKIKFGIDGWWGIIAKDFTLSNVTKVASGIARWMTNKFGASSVVLGYDTRFGGEMFMEAVAKILASKGIQVFISESFITSPMLSLGVVKLKAQCGVMITASHNPASYNGMKLKGSYGGPLLKTDLDDIQNLIASDYEFDLEMLNWNYLLEQRKIQYINLESIYLKHLNDTFNISSLNKSGMQFGFDAMYGSSQQVMLKLFPGIRHFHCNVNPSFNNIPPDPLYRNLFELAEHINQHNDVDVAFAVDADGDRLAFFDERGNYVSSHQLFLLVIHYLVKYEGQSGKVLAGFSMTQKIEKLCAHYGLEVQRTKVGFNSITDVMLREDILAGGQETGGITLGNYLPERDALWLGIQIWQWLHDSKRKLSDMLSEIVEITGTFAFDKTDLTYNRNERSKIWEKCRNGEFTEFGKKLVTKIEDVDGYKFYFGEDEWILMRPSSLYPIIRLYAEAPDISTVRELMQSVIGQLNKDLQVNV